GRGWSRIPATGRPRPASSPADNGRRRCVRPALRRFFRAASGSACCRGLCSFVPVFKGIGAYLPRREYSAGALIPERLSIINNLWDNAGLTSVTGPEKPIPRRNIMTATATAASPRTAAQPGAIIVEPMGEQIGADIIGLDLTQPVSDSQFRQIHDAWMKHLV